MNTLSVRDIYYKQTSLNGADYLTAACCCTLAGLEKFWCAQECLKPKHPFWECRVKCAARSVTSQASDEAQWLTMTHGTPIAHHPYEGMLVCVWVYVCACVR